MKLITTIDYLHSKNGGAQRVLNLITEYNINEVHICSITRKGSYVSGNVFINYHPIKLKDCLDIFVTSLINKRPLSNALYFRSSLSDVLKYDNIVFHLSRSIQSKTIEEINKKWILDFCESHGHNLKLRSKSYSYFFKLLLRFESKRLLKFEKKLIRTFSKVIFITQNDIQFGNAKNKLLLPNKIELKQIKLEYEQKVKNQICFLGDMNYLPNKNALKFIDQYITEKNYSVKVFGKPPKKKISLCNEDKIHFEGYVEELDKVLPYSFVSIFYSNDSTGLQNKLLDYLNFGIPVITNSEVADCFIPGYPFLIIKETKDIDPIIQNLLNKDYYMKIVDSGHAYLKICYGK